MNFVHLYCRTTVTLFSYCRTWTAQLNYMQNAVLCLMMTQHVDRYRMKTVKNSWPYKIYEYKQHNRCSTVNIFYLPFGILACSELILHLHLVLGQDEWFPGPLCFFLSWSHQHWQCNFYNIYLMVMEGQH